MKVRRSLAVLAAAALSCSLATVAPAQATGQGAGRGGFDIQKAVNRADPGDTIRIPSGTYRQTVTIRKDGIKLVGRHVVIKPPANARPTPCDRLFAEPGAPPSASGICIMGKVTPAGVVRDRARNVTIKGITVVGAPVHGLIGIGTRNLKVTHSTFKRNGGYGAASFITVRTTFAHDTAIGNGEAGFYVGDSPHAKARVHHNHSLRNELGFFFRHASHGKAEHNVAKGNCLGMLVLADAPGPAKHWTLTKNEVVRNNKVCPAPFPDRSISGAGIVLSGAQQFTVSRNTVAHHRSRAPEARPSLAEGGIVVSNLVGGPTKPSGKVVKNHAFKNRPVDVRWDRTGRVTFTANKCGTSRPRFICD